MVEIVNPQDAVRAEEVGKVAVYEQIKRFAAAHAARTVLLWQGREEAAKTGETQTLLEWKGVVREVEKLRDAERELEKFRERASLLSASTMGEAFDRLEELVEKEKELATERSQGAAMASITGEAIRQIAEERDAAREELVKAARLREQLAQSTFGPALDKLARDIVGVGADDVHPAEEIAVKWSRLREVLANPATTAEPAAS